MSSNAASHLDHYVVVVHEGEWKVAHNGSHSARYRTKQEALFDAIRRAQKSARRGQHAVVSAEDEGLLFQTNAKPSSAFPNFPSRWGTVASRASKR